MFREEISWYSTRLQHHMSIRIYGEKGTPVLVFPTQDAMSDNFENFGMIDTLSGYIESGKIQLFCVDTVDAATWSNVWGDKGWRAGRQESYYNYIVEEVLPFITERNGTGILPIVLFAVETFLPNPGDYSFLYTGDASNLTTKWWLTAENVTENGMYGQKGILYNETIWHAFGGTILTSVACALLAGTIGTLIGYAVAKQRRSKWANYVNSVAFLPYLMPSIAVGVAFFILFSNKYLNLYNTYTLLIITGTVKYIPFASRSSLNSMLQLSGEIEEAAIIQDVPWIKRMTRIIIPIQKSSIISGYLLPFMTCLRELTLFMLLCSQTKIITTLLDYFDEMGLYAFSSGINLILIVVILIFNALVNKLTGASIDSGIGGGDSK